MEDNQSNQIKTSLLTNETETSQSKRRAYTQPLDLRQNIQGGKQSNNTSQVQNEDSIIINQESFINNHNYAARYSVGGQVGIGQHSQGDNQQQRQQQRNQQDFLSQDDNSVNNNYENENEDDMNENLEEQNDIQQNQEMSSLFLSIFKDNRLFVIAVIICDAVMGLIALIVYNKRCSMSDLQQWNLQWGYYFLAKAIYHSLIFLQFYSQSRKLDICEKLGEHITPEENNIREYEYQMSYTERQRTQIRRSLEKNTLLKTSYYLKSLITLTYVIYGLVVFFKGNYFNIWISNSSSQTQQSCDYSLTWWVYLSIILVIACNRQIFDLILIIAIISPSFNLFHKSKSISL